jgi:hypothetical protein
MFNYFMFELYSIQARRQSTKTHNTYQLLPPDDGLLATPKHVEM